MDNELKEAAMKFCRTCHGQGLENEQERAACYSDFIHGAFWLCHYAESHVDKKAFLTDERFRGAEELVEELKDITAGAL